MSLGRFWDFARIYKFYKTKIGGKTYDYKAYLYADGKPSGEIDVLLIDGKRPPWFKRYYTKLSTDPIALQLRAASLAPALPHHNFREDRTALYRQQVQRGFHAGVRPGKPGHGKRGSESLPQTTAPEMPAPTAETPVWVWVGGGAALIGVAYLLTHNGKKAEK